MPTRPPSRSALPARCTLAAATCKVELWQHCLKAEAWEYVKQLKERRLDQLLTPADPDWPFLAALLARHPRAGAAVQPHPRSPPVVAFVARRHRGVQNELRYVDGRGETDFSALKCLR